MRWLVSLIVIAIMAVGLALAGRYDPGYVVLVYPPWRAELSFVSFLLLLAMLVTGAYLLTRLAIITLNLPEAVKARHQRREAERQNALFTDALAAYLEGRYQEAEKLASRIQSDPQRIQLGRVLAARSAAEIRAYSRRDAYLAEARESESPLAALFAEAETRLSERDATGALTAIEAGKVIAPAHTALSRLELKARQMLGQWDDVLKLAEQLAKSNALEPAALDHVRRNAHLGNIRRRASDDKGLLEYWRKLPEAFRTDPVNALEAANAFKELGGNDTAVDILEAALNTSWDESLTARYGQIVGKNPLKQIERAEKWLTEHPHDGALLMSLADLCAHEKLWGKAQSYAEASLAVAPNVDAHLALAALKEQTGQMGEACRHLKKALELCRRAG
ncbi:MAG: heme biosynthesis protein HemY [Hydrogenophilaceae bacterium]|nr:heme biosynthesis protein HemY [Hydrogenophilaceae bacterium]